MAVFSRGAFLMKEVDKKGCRNVTRMGRGRTELRLEQVILLIYDHAFFFTSNHIYFQPKRLCSDEERRKEVTDNDDDNNDGVDDDIDDLCS